MLDLFGCVIGCCLGIVLVGCFCGVGLGWVVGVCCCFVGVGFLFCLMMAGFYINSVGIPLLWSLKSVFCLLLFSVYYDIVVSLFAFVGLIWLFLGVAAIISWLLCVLDECCVGLVVMVCCSWLFIVVLL